MRISTAPRVDQIRSAAALAHSTASLSLKIICVDGTEVIVGHGKEARVNPCHFRKLVGDEDFTERGVELISSVLVVGASRVLGPGLMCIENQDLEHYRFVTMLDLDVVMTTLENCVEDMNKESSRCLFWWMKFLMLCLFLLRAPGVGASSKKEH